MNSRAVQLPRFISCLLLGGQWKVTHASVSLISFHFSGGFLLLVNYFMLGGQEGQCKLASCTSIPGNFFLGFIYVLCKNKLQCTPRCIVSSKSLNSQLFQSLGIPTWDVIKIL